MRMADEGTRAAGEIRAEIEQRFGFFPPFFGPALDRPAVLDNLWQHTLRSYVGNTLPALFLERTFAVLSRYCDVPYCVVSHSCALRPMGMNAQQILDLLDGPRGLPDPDEAAVVLGAAPQHPLGWATPGPLADAALRAVVSMFLRDSDRSRLAAALRRVLPPDDMDQLVLFLGYVNTCLEWVEAHPELSYEADLRAITNLGPLLAEQPALGKFFADYIRRRSATLTGREAVLAAQAEEADRRFVLAFDHAPIGMALVDLDGRFMKVNRSLCDILGYEPAALTAMTFADITHPDDVTDSLQAVRRLIAGDLQVHQTDKRYRHARGHWVVGRLSTALLRAGDGTPLQFVAQVEDVTGLRANQDQLAAANAELRRNNRDLEQFAVIAAHDLKGPLAAITGTASLLAEELADSTPPAAQELTRRIATASTRMADLVDDLLAYAQAGTEKVTARRVDIDDLLAELLADMRPQIEAAHAHVLTTPLGHVYAHPTHLRQVFGNLITNAMKYTKPGVTPTVEITATQHDDDIVYTIADNGIGVPADAARSIFEMFHRGHGTSAPGTGIGLAICQRIIERYGGAIWVEERPGGGSLFHVRLPLEPTGRSQTENNIYSTL